MKALLIIILSLAVVNCGKKKFTSNQTDLSTDHTTVHHDDNNDDDTNNDDDQNSNCPRYDLVVKSTHTLNKKLNFTYTFNAEMTFTSLEGKHNILFSKAKYSPCSGDYVNTSILPSLNPLKTTEDLTGEVMITDGATCVSSSRDTTFQVIDSATSEVLFDEQDLKTQLGCEFGYTDAGKLMRKNLIDLADGVAQAKGAACN
jgi:uncharacterized protein YxeA